VRLSELRLENLRNIVELEFRPEPGFNVLTGANGAGKTSILEGIYLLSHARSFRTRRAELLVRNGSDELTVFGAIDSADGVASRLGLTQGRGRWTARLNGERPPTLAAMLKHCAVVCFEPGSHALISGGSDERREFLDWGVFHVEHGFADVARRYRRALRQRNAALRTTCSDRELDAWDEELAAAAQPLDALRLSYFQRFTPGLAGILAKYVPELGEARVEISPGWRARAEEGLLRQLRASRSIDRTRGHTTKGPHRSDWSLRFEQAPRREHLSRGQEKLCAIACMLAQAELYREDHREWPIVLLDDLPSELDRHHQEQVVASLQTHAQVFVTSTELPAVLQRPEAAVRQFHVEQGRLRALL
jgi:DNA replication and repair protein RecF